MKRYEITITETSRSHLKVKPEIYNEFTVTLATLQEVKEYLIERYGKLPTRKSRLFYIGSQPIGYLYSRWALEYPFSGKYYYQTDWIAVQEVHTKPVPLKELKK